MRDRDEEVDEDIVRSNQSSALLGLSRVTDLFDEPDDATPLTLEEKQGLLQAHITIDGS